MMEMALPVHKHHFERPLNKNGGGMLQVRGKGRIKLRIMRKGQSDAPDKAGGGAVKVSVKALD